MKCLGRRVRQSDDISSTALSLWMKKKSLLLFFRIGIFAVLDPVRVDDDAAPLRLPEDRIERHDGNSARSDDILQYIARAD